jgi:hypothetical protein
MNKGKRNEKDENSSESTEDEKPKEEESKKMSKVPPPDQEGAASLTDIPSREPDDIAVGNYQTVNGGVAPRDPEGNPEAIGSDDSVREDVDILNVQQKVGVKKDKGSAARLKPMRRYSNRTKVLNRYKSMFNFVLTPKDETSVIDTITFQGTDTTWSLTGATGQLALIRYDLDKGGESSSDTAAPSVVAQVSDVTTLPYDMVYGNDGMWMSRIVHAITEIVMCVWNARRLWHGLTMVEQTDRRSRILETDTNFLFEVSKSTQLVMTAVRDRALWFGKVAFRDIGPYNIEYTAPAPTFSNEGEIINLGYAANARRRVSYNTVRESMLPFLSATTTLQAVVNTIREETYVMSPNTRLLASWMISQGNYGGTVPTVVELAMEHHRQVQRTYSWFTFGRAQNAAANVRVDMAQNNQITNPFTSRVANAAGSRTSSLELADMNMVNALCGIVKLDFRWSISVNATAMLYSITSFVIGYQMFTRTKMWSHRSIYGFVHITAYLFRSIIGPANAAGWFRGGADLESIDEALLETEPVWATVALTPINDFIFHALTPTQGILLGNNDLVNLVETINESRWSRTAGQAQERQDALSRAFAALRINVGATREIVTSVRNAFGAMLAYFTPTSSVTDQILAAQNEMSKYSLPGSLHLQELSVIGVYNAVTDFPDFLEDPVTTTNAKNEAIENTYVFRQTFDDGMISMYTDLILLTNAESITRFQPWEMYLREMELCEEIAHPIQIMRLYSLVLDAYGGQTVTTARLIFEYISRNFGLETDIFERVRAFPQMKNIAARVTLDGAAFDVLEQDDVRMLDLVGPVGDNRTRDLYRQRLAVIVLHGSRKLTNFTDGHPNVLTANQNARAVDIVNGNGAVGQALVFQPRAAGPFQFRNDTHWDIQGERISISEFMSLEPTKLDDLERYLEEDDTRLVYISDPVPSSIVVDVPEFGLVSWRSLREKGYVQVIERSPTSNAFKTDRIQFNYAVVSGERPILLPNQKQMITANQFQPDGFEEFLLDPTVVPPPSAVQRDGPLASRIHIIKKDMNIGFALKY